VIRLSPLHPGYVITVCAFTPASSHIAAIRADSREIIAGDGAEAVLLMVVELYRGTLSFSLSISVSCRYQLEQWAERAREGTSSEGVSEGRLWIWIWIWTLWLAVLDATSYLSDQQAGKQQHQPHAALAPWVPLAALVLWSSACSRWPSCSHLVVLAARRFSFAERVACSAVVFL